MELLSLSHGSPDFVTFPSLKYPAPHAISFLELSRKHIHTTFYQSVKSCLLQPPASYFNSNDVPSTKPAVMVALLWQHISFHSNCNTHFNFY